MGLKWVCGCWTHGITKFTYALSHNDKQCWTLPFFLFFFHSDPLSKINSILFLFLSSYFLLKTLTWQWLCSEEEAVFNLQQFIHFSFLYLFIDCYGRLQRGLFWKYRELEKCSAQTLAKLLPKQHWEWEECEGTGKNIYNAGWWKQKMCCKMPS